jgi:phosphoglycolate phosphatase
MGVVFDLDGTLVDSRRDLAAAIAATRERFGLPPLPLDEVTSMVGEGARTLVRRALPAEIAGDAFEAAFATYTELYLARCLVETRPYPGVVAMLEVLAPRWRLGVLTNKPERPSRLILDGLGLAPFLDVLVGGDGPAARKPDPAGLQAIARGWGTTPDRLLLVGDSRVDADTATAGGAALALVAWGYGKAEELEGIPAWRVGRPTEIVEGLAAGADGNPGIGPRG